METYSTNLIVRQFNSCETICKDNSFYLIDKYYYDPPFYHLDYNLYNLIPDQQNPAIHRFEEKSTQNNITTIANGSDKGFLAASSRIIPHIYISSIT